ncbi:cytochrome c oxidase assembly protein [Brevibacillus agri]|uniref:cytochrome c oxidase assembly protein n=1 Tax=Brevibacillus agri TaxID=51101 RepID=UPI0025B671CC|nr:cytochrome c oxidase assembly protein [Brevibacillus agri]MDN4092736.1 cytochrome c oxidase assembly protein [Brevibacillus agri]MDR9504028.1 cytochrome c oxidase assembly protein [Brevibacillus agri]
MGQHQHELSAMNATASFSDLWSPDVMLFTLLIATVYFLVTGPMHKLFENATMATTRQKLLFVFALLLFYAAQGSPISYYGHHYLFSLHMLQQSILYFALPPIVLLAMPEWLLEKIFQPRPLNAMLRAFTHPLVAALLFNTLFSFYHIPFIFDAAALHHQWMTVYHVILILAAFAMWWPIVSPLSDSKRQLAGLKKLVYIFVNGVLITPACALIIFASDPLYATYISAPQLFPSLSTFSDQRLGGIIMKLVQELVYGSVLAYVFYHWYKQEKQDDLPMDEQPGALLMKTPATDEGRV